MVDVLTQQTFGQVTVVRPHRFQQAAVFGGDFPRAWASVAPRLTHCPKEQIVPSEDGHCLRVGSDRQDCLMKPSVDFQKLLDVAPADIGVVLILDLFQPVNVA